MRRHFYLILIICISISGLSVSYSQEHVNESENTSEIETKPGSIDRDKAPAKKNDSSQVIDPVEKKALERSDAQGGSEDTDNKSNGQDKKTKPEKQNKPVELGGNDPRSVSSEQVPGKVKETDAKKPVQANDGSLLIRRLLEVDDENYKYSRIPDFQKGKVIEKSELPVVTTATELENTKSPVPSSKENNEGAGLLGMSKSTSDLLIKGSLVIFILVIFILYKLRSRGNSKTVLRSFPKR